MLVTTTHDKITKTTTFSKSFLVALTMQSMKPSLLITELNPHLLEWWMSGFGYTIKLAKFPCVATSFCTYFEKSTLWMSFKIHAWRRREVTPLWGDGKLFFMHDYTRHWHQWYVLPSKNVCQSIEETYLWCRHGIVVGMENLKCCLRCVALELDKRF